MFFEVGIKRGVSSFGGEWSTKGNEVFGILCIVGQAMSQCLPNGESKFKSTLKLDEIFDTPNNAEIRSAVEIDFHFSDGRSSKNHLFYRFVQKKTIITEFRKHG